MRNKNSTQSHIYILKTNYFGRTPRFAEKQPFVNVQYIGPLSFTCCRYKELNFDWLYLDSRASRNQNLIF